MLTKVGAFGICIVSLCVMLVLSLWSSDTLLAEVQSALKKSRSATYTVTISIGDQPAQTWNVKLLGDSLARLDQPNGIYLIFDVQRKKIMEVNPRESKVRITENLSIPGDFNILAKLVNPSSLAVKDQPPLPEREIGGKKATGFVIDEGGVRYSVWIDPKTNLPLEMVRMSEESKDDMPVTEKWTEFRFDDPLDKSLFAFDVPKGFAVDTRQAPMADPQKQVEDERNRAQKAKEEADRKRGEGK